MIGDRAIIGSAWATPPVLRLAGILAVGAILRLAGLGRQSLWLDEASSYWIANRSPASLLASLPSIDPHPPLYYLMLQPMITLGGNEWLLRLPSALASMASLAFVYMLGNELFDRETGLLSALILTCSPLQIWYAQEARMYALVTALCLAAALYLARALRTNHPTAWVLTGISQGLALWVDTAAIWFTLALIVAPLLLAPTLWGSRRLWPWLAAQALALILYMPWLPAFLQQLNGGFAGWIPPATITVVLRTLADFVGSYERSSAEAMLALVMLLTGLAAGARQLAREAIADRQVYVLLICWFIVPIGVAFLVSQPYVQVPLLLLIFSSDRSIFLTRNLIVAAFPLCLLFARSLMQASRIMRRGVLVGLLVLNLAGYVGNTIPKRKDDYRTVASVVHKRALTGDVIVFAPPYLKLPFAYYYDRSDRREVSLASLRDGVLAPSGVSPLPSAPAAPVGHRRIWLVSTANVYQKDTKAVGAAIAANGQLVERWQGAGVTASLYLIGQRSQSLGKNHRRAR